MTYLLGALQRYECQMNALDLKKTCFGLSLDGESAFEVVDRTIQKRELFAVGEEGDIWQYSNNGYENTTTHFKMEGKLSRPIEEKLGVLQGKIKSSDHYKIFNSPALDSLDNFHLGYQLGQDCP